MFFVYLFIVSGVCNDVARLGLAFGRKKIKKLGIGKGSWFVYDGGYLKQGTYFFFFLVCCLAFFLRCSGSISPDM